MIECQWSQQKKKTTQIANGTGPGVRRSKRPWHAAPVANVLWKPLAIR